MKYQLIEIATNNVVYESDNTVEFGGPWGDSSLFKWQETPTSRLLELAKQNKVAEIKTAFEQALLQGFTCSNGITMDAHIDAIGKLKAGYDLALLLNQTMMDLRDFNNVTQPNVAVADVLAMITELGSNYQSLWTKKNTLIDQINAKKKIANVESVVW